MNHPRIVLLGVVALIVMIILVGIGFSPRMRPEQVSNAGTGRSPFSEEYAPHFPINAFLPSSGQIFLGGGSPQNAAPPVFQGKPVTTLEEVANIIAGTVSGTADSSGKTKADEFLPLPDVADSEIQIDASGSANIADYLAYFNTHSIDGGLVFDYKKFDNVLKDVNGVMLFAPELVSEALVDNNFARIHDSLLVYKEFANAEIVYLGSIKVAAPVALIHKKNIAFEKLLVMLIDKALAVEAGTLPKSGLKDFFDQFVTTATGAHQELLRQAGVISLNPGGSWFDPLLRTIGFTTPAYAQFKPVFGGRINLPIFCPCSAGFWVIVGPPNPTSLFVPVAVIANPLLFHLWRQLRPGVWWLGIYLPAVIPCLSAVCTPIGGGNLYLMGGTSLF